MNKLKHTPGPWKVEQETRIDDNFCIYGPGRNGWEATYIASILISKGITSSKHETSNEAEANARLIATAPELLEFAYEMAEYFTQNPSGYSELRNKCYLVINRAEKGTK